MWTLVPARGPKRWRKSPDWRHPRPKLGLSRKTATEFSFFLAIPTLLAATFYSLYKARDILSATDVPLFGLGTVAAFISAFLCVRWLLRYISSHDFTFFAWYRIVFGVVVLATAWLGWVQWAE